MKKQSKTQDNDSRHLGVSKGSGKRNKRKNEDGYFYLTITLYSLSAIVMSYIAVRSITLLIESLSK